MNTKSLRIPYALAVHDEAETERVLSVLNEHRTIMGRETGEFETRSAPYFGKQYGVMVNSGSSANLLAIELLSLPPGSEVITPLLTFSTTVAPLLQKRLVPVFTDVERGKYTMNVEEIESLITKSTKAIFVPLLLGNIPNLKKIRAIAKEHNLSVIDDSCDTFGGRFANKPSGSYTDITTTSFYGSHIITAGGGGGMILVNSAKWRDRAKVLRGWGRTSSLFAESEDIKKRYQNKLAGIPYDAKFIFSEVGYNLLPMEMGAAFGNAQLDKLEQFRKTREKNFAELLSFFKQYESYFILPQQDTEVKTQWLAFPLCIRSSSPFTRLEIVTYLEHHNIQTRPVFTGNIRKHPAFKSRLSLSVRGKNRVTNEIMKNAFLIGCHHGLEEIHLAKIKETFESFLQKKKH